MNDREVKIIIEAVNKATPVLSQISNSLKQLDQSTENTGKKTTSWLSSLGTSWTNFAIQASAAIYLIEKVMGYLGKSFSMIELGAKLEQQEIAFANLAKSFGANGDKIIASMKKMSRGTINEFELMQQASRALTLGIAPENLTKLMEIARSSAIAMGLSTAEAFEKITFGIAKQRAKILDDLGIIIKAEEANKTYAATLHKSVNNLTEAEKAQAFLNATMIAGENIINRVSAATLTQAEKVAQLRERWQAFVNGTAILFLKLFDAVTMGWHIISTVFDAIMVAIIKINSWIVDKLIVSFNMLIAVTEKLPLNLGKKMTEGLKGAVSYLEDTKKNLENVGESWSNSMNMAALSIVNDYELISGKAKETAKNMTKEFKKANEEINKNTKFTAEMDIKIWKDAAVSACNNMINAFDNIFFDGVTNGFRDLNKILIDFGNAMIRVLTNFLAQQAVAHLLPSLFSVGAMATGSAAAASATGSSTSLVGSYSSTIHHTGGIFKPNDPNSKVRSDEGLAILKAGEEILTPEQSKSRGGNGGVVQNTYNINAIDSKSFVQMISQNPEIIVQIINKSIQDNGSTRKYMRKYA